MAERFEAVKTTAIPAVGGRVAFLKANIPQTEEEMEEMRGITYREALGAVMWSSTMTHPDKPGLEMSGETIQLVGGSIAWFSRTQQEEVVALSSFEAEYVALV